MDHRPHIIVVEDEATQRQLLVDYLDKQNFRVSGADGGGALRRLVERELPALVLLDVGLPGEDGFALARWLREKSGRIGIIMVTAASDTVDRVVGLETGADDYIGKPYEPRELLARIKSVLRRVDRRAGRRRGPRVRMGRRVLDLEKRVLVDPADGSEETLTASEFDLLKVFAENPNRPLTRDWLLECDGAPRDGGVRPRHRSAHHAAAPQDRGRPGASRRDPHRARRRLHVRAAEGLRSRCDHQRERVRALMLSSSAAASPGCRRRRPRCKGGAASSMIERATEEERGGNTRWTEALSAHEERATRSPMTSRRISRANAGYYSRPDACRRDRARPRATGRPILKTLNFTDPEMIATLRRTGRPDVALAQELWRPLRFSADAISSPPAQPRMAPVGGGLALIEALAGWCREHGGAVILYETTARSLHSGRRWRASSACAASGPRPPARSSSARRAVILASGGFEGNPEMLTHYLGPRAPFIRPVARGGYYNKGEGIRMALAIGAAPAAAISAATTPSRIDPRSGATEPVVLRVQLRHSGQQATASVSPTRRRRTVDATYEAITRARSSSSPTASPMPSSMQRIDDVPNWRALSAHRPAADHGRTRCAELAGKLGIAAATLVRNTIEAYNAACAAGRVHGRWRPTASPRQAPVPPQVELGAAARRGALPRLSDHLRQLLHLWRAQGRHRKAQVVDAETMHPRFLLGPAALTLALSLSPAAIPAQAATAAFAALAGNWSGGGTMQLANGGREPLRCRASYAVGSGGGKLRLSIRCASDSYRIDWPATSRATARPISGQWSEVEPERVRLAQRARHRQPHQRGRGAQRCFSANLSSDHARRPPDHRDPAARRDHHRVQMRFAFDRSDVDRR